MYGWKYRYTAVLSAASHQRNCLGYGCQTRGFPVILLEAVQLVFLGFWPCLYHVLIVRMEIPVHSRPYGWLPSSDCSRIRLATLGGSDNFSRSTSADLSGFLTPLWTCICCTDGNISTQPTRHTVLFLSRVQVLVGRPEGFRFNFQEQSSPCFYDFDCVFDLY